MAREFPKPPGYKPVPVNETTPGCVPDPASPESPFGNQAPGEPVDDYHTTGQHKLTDEETLYILKQYLRPNQMDDPKLIRFIMSYLENRSASQAAREAGMPGKGSYLRSRPEIHASIEALTAKAVMKYGYDASEIIERVKEIAILDLAEFENPDGSFKTHLTQIRPEARRAIKKFKAKNIYGEDANGMRSVIGQLIEVELWDKLKSLELLGREKNIMKETKKIEHDVTNKMADVLLASKERAELREVNRVRLGPGVIDQMPDVEIKLQDNSNGGTNETNS